MGHRVSCNITPVAFHCYSIQYNFVRAQQNVISITIKNVSIGCSSSKPSNTLN